MNLRIVNDFAYFYYISYTLNGHYYFVSLERKPIPMTDWKNYHFDDPSMWPKNVIVPKICPHEDERGSIQPLYDLPTKSVVLISSIKGSVRANHYHLTDWHFCYIVSGQIDYYHRAHGSNVAPERVRILVGQLFFTPPLVDHAMVFTKDTTFFTFGRNPRDQKSYEADVRRIRMIDPNSLKFVP